MGGLFSSSTVVNNSANCDNTRPRDSFRERRQWDRKHRRDKRYKRYNQYKRKQGKQEPVEQLSCFVCRHTSLPKYGDITRYCEHRSYCQVCSGKIKTCTLCEARLDQEHEIRIGLLNQFLIPELSRICLGYLPTRIKISLQFFELDHDGNCSGGEPDTEEQGEIEYFLALRDGETVDALQDEDLLQYPSVKAMSVEYRKCQGSGYCGPPSIRMVNKAALL